MTRKRIVGGRMTIITQKDHNLYATQGNIVNNASISVVETGTDSGVSYGEYQPPQPSTDLVMVTNAFIAESYVENEYHKITDGVIGHDFYVKIIGKNLEGKKVKITLFDRDNTIATGNLGESYGGKSQAVYLLQEENEKLELEGSFDEKDENNNNIAVIKFSLRPSSDDDLTTLRQNIIDSRTKKALLYVMVDVHSPNADINEEDVSYSGFYPQIGTGMSQTDQLRNFWLNSEGNFFEVYPCFCNKNFNTSEVKDLIYHLRDSFGYKTHREKLFDLGADKLEGIHTESIAGNGENLVPFTDQMNSTFRKFSINTCTRKIHFLSQMYVETMHFRSTNEGISSICRRYSGGCDYRGRGMKQITHDYNHIAYYDYFNGTKYSEAYDAIRGNRTGISLQEVINLARSEQERRNLTLDGNASEPRSNHIYLLLQEDLVQNLLDFIPNLSTDVYHAFNSAGWFSTVYRGDVLSAMDQGLTNNNITRVTNLINGGNNNIGDRGAAATYLIEFFNFQQCVNN